MEISTVLQGHNESKHWYVNDNKVFVFCSITSLIPGIDTNFECNLLVFLCQCASPDNCNNE